MAKHTTSKLTQMAAGQARENGTVFSKKIMPNANMSKIINNNETKYIRGNIEMSNIIVPTNVDITSLSEEVKKSILEYLVSPIILKHEYEIAERGGRKFKKRTGRYIILDGNKRAELYKEAGRHEIFSLVLPLDITEDEEKLFVSNVKNAGVENAVSTIQKTYDGEITNCYHYEVQEVQEDKLEERENKYSIIDSEVDALAESIWSVGLLQPIVVLPELDYQSQVHYIIQAGHKRVKAIRRLKEQCQNKDSKYYLYKDIILEKFETIPALIIPSGATQQEIEQIYNETNLLSRHMTTEDVFAHIECIGPEFKRPRTEAEYNEFVGRNRLMKDYVKDAKEYFKKLGFRDWATSKTSYFLNVHFYGSDLAVELFEKCGDTTLKKEEKPNLTQKEIYWVVIHNNNSFDDRSKQTKILEQALNDKSYLIDLMASTTPSRKTKSVKIKKLNENITKQKATLEKMRFTPIDFTNSTSNDLEKTLQLLKETKEVIKTFEIVLENYKK